MARTNGPIKVYSRSDTVPTDGEGGYAGGDSTAAALAGVAAGAAAETGSVRAIAENAAATAEQAGTDAEEALSRLPVDDGAGATSVTVLDEQQRRTWLEATEATGGPTRHAQEHIGVIHEDRGDALLQVTDGEKVMTVVDASGHLGGTLLRYSGKSLGAIPARAGGVRGDAVVERHAGLATMVPVSGRDDTRALNDLLTSVSADGGGTVVLDGHTIISGRITVPANVTLAGTSRRSASLTLADASNPTSILALVGSRSGVRNISIYGNSYRQTYTANGGIRIPVAADGRTVTNGVVGSGIWSNPSAAEDAALGDNVNYDKHLLLRDVSIFDVYGAGVWGWGSLGETRLENVYAQRCGVGFVLPPDSFATDCTAAESEAHGFVVTHGSGHYANCKSFRSGAIVRTDLADQPVAYTRKAAAGFYVQGSGSNSVFAACDAQNNGGPGLEITSPTASLNGQFMLDANNIFAGYGQLPWTIPTPRVGTEITTHQKYGPDGTTERSLTPEDYPGAVIGGEGHNLHLTSNVAGFQSAGTAVGFQVHGIDISGTTRSTITLGHASSAHRQDGLTRPPSSPIKPGWTPGENHVTANGSRLDERATL